jgi:exopolysaccharide biosynthesis polyprenyl glycosylphosphotransferase
MLRRDRQLRVQLYQYIDGGIFALGLWLAWLIRYNWAKLGPRWLGDWLPMHAFDPIGPFWDDYFWLFLVVIPITPLVLESQGFYERPFFSPVRQMAWQLGRSCLLGAVGLILMEFMLKRQGARGVFVLFGFCSFGLMFLKEELLRLGYKSRLGQEQFRRRIILAGTEEDTRELRRDIAQRAEDLEVVEEFDLDGKTIEDLVASLHQHSANAVVVAARPGFFDKVEKAVRACELEGIEIWLLANFFQTENSETSLDDFYGRRVMVFRCGTGISWPRLVKQIIDFVGALVLLAVSSPLLAAAAVAVKLSSRGPVLFRQARAGLNGKPFIMYKFRSMVTNAEQLKQELERLNEMSGPVFKVTNDPRVTKVGRLLRRTSLDEWPQLVNVLRFEMSLVGPRPLPVDEVQRFDDRAHRRRLSVRPGITCTWQVSGRNDVRDFKDWVRMDLAYIDNWSLWLDIKILWRTIWVVLLGKGAR